ncbi:hypothetical protein HID58_060252 [Brassica napus]|uniref:Uncharacterized protein n=1 Tax=Brassica napus TaxID=3708 RepID=A0ABQ7ZV71_BRANA|nr:hypothetical protein HID58_060252 [Brassica napus]
MIQKSNTGLKKVTHQKSMKDRHKRKMNNNKKMTHKSMQMWTSDGEVNEDASKKPVKVTKKRGRGNKGKKKSVKPPREVQQQLEDDAEIGAKESENSETNEDGEVNEDASKKPVKVTKKRERGNKDGEVNEDASKKPVKFTKKRGRGNKEPNVDTSKSKRQKKQEDSAGDVIGRVS